MRKPNEQRGSMSLEATSQAVLVAVLMIFTIQTVRAQVFTVVHHFNGFPNDGAFPLTNLVQDTAGNLYGTTSQAGTFGGGTVFKLDPTGKKTVLFNFFKDTRLDAGFHPFAGLTLDAAGNLYGTTVTGGDHTCDPPFGCGTVFKLDPTGRLTVLHRFHGLDGDQPFAGLVLDAAGNLYGTTAGGGVSTFCNGFIGCGVVFKLDTTGKLSVLHGFTNSPDGATPAADLVLDTVGNLYGTTGRGGDSDCRCGTIFKIDATGAETILHTFRGFVGEGIGPDGGLVLDATTGSLYGTTSGTSQIGGSGPGTIFVLQSGTLSVLHQFTKSEGSPGGDLVLDKAGNLYGTTVDGGFLTCKRTSGFGCGTVFKWSPLTGLAELYRFTATSDGYFPEAGLFRDAAGNLYGTTFRGGFFDDECGTSDVGCGVVFKITP